MKKPKVLCIIPARGGSKGVPRKNIRLLGGKPLIAWTVQSALECKELFHRVIVTTDDPEIADQSVKWGAEVPFSRPAELAGDKVPMIPVLQHAVRWVEENDGITLDWIYLLQPTAPFRSKDDVVSAFKLAIEGDTDSVISVHREYAHHPILMKKIEGDRLIPYCIEEKEGTRRQDYDPPAYIRNGHIYITKRNVLMEKNSIWGDSIAPYVMPEEGHISIDSEHDFLLAELLAKRWIR